jgi:hypothetical protein
VSPLPAQRPPILGWRARQPLPEPVPDHLCQLCGGQLAPGPATDDGLCAGCRAVLDGDPAAWAESGGRVCRRCHNPVPTRTGVQGLCPCGGQLL